MTAGRASQIYQPSSADLIRRSRFGKARRNHVIPDAR
jgi:hypothetical protein